MAVGTCSGSGSPPRTITSTGPLWSRGGGGAIVALRGTCSACGKEMSLTGTKRRRAVRQHRS